MIYYDNNPMSTVVKEDEDLMDMYAAMPDENDMNIMQNLSSWMLRIELNPNDLLDRDIKLKEIKQKIL